MAKFGLLPTRDLPLHLSIWIWSSKESRQFQELGQCPNDYWSQSTKIPHCASAAKKPDLHLIQADKSTNDTANTREILDSTLGRAWSSTGLSDLALLGSRLSRSSESLALMLAVRCCAAESGLD